MRTRAGIVVAAVGGALATVVAGVAFAATPTAVGPSPAPLTEAAEATCTTDSGGFCTVHHGLGVVPAAVVVSPNTPAPYNAFMLNTVLGSYTATSFQVRAMFGQTQPKPYGQIWFTYVAYAGAPTPPPPTTTIPTRTTAPPPTSTTTHPPSTTTPPTTTPTGGGS